MFFDTSILEEYQIKHQTPMFPQELYLASKTKENVDPIEDCELYLINLFQRAKVADSTVIYRLSDVQLNLVKREIIVTFWEVVKRFKLSESTLYSAISIFSRMLENSKICSSIDLPPCKESTPGTRELNILGFVAIRLATKIEECPEVMYRMILQDALSESFPIIAKYVSGKETHQKCSQWEQLCVDELHTQFDGPLPSEWLDVIIKVGLRLNVIPKDKPQRDGKSPRPTFREMCRYIMALGTVAIPTASQESIFPKRTTGLVHACAAVQLAIRIQNTINASKTGPIGRYMNSKYETWPDELADFLSVDSDTLQPNIKILSGLLRNAPPQLSGILRKLDSVEFSASKGYQTNIQSTPNAKFFGGWASIRWQ